MSVFAKKIDIVDIVNFIWLPSFYYLQFFTLMFNFYVFNCYKFGHYNQTHWLNKQYEINKNYSLVLFTVKTTILEL